MVPVATMRTSPNTPNILSRIATHGQEERVAYGTYLTGEMLGDQRDSSAMSRRESMSKSFLRHRGETEPCVTGIGCTKGD